MLRHLLERWLRLIVAAADLGLFLELSWEIIEVYEFSLSCRNFQSILKLFDFG